MTVGLKDIRTAIDLLELKMWIGNKGKSMKVDKVIMANEKHGFADNGLRIKEKKRVAMKIIGATDELKN